MPENSSIYCDYLTKKCTAIVFLLRGSIGILLLVFGKLATEKYVFMTLLMLFFGLILYPKKFSNE